MMKLSDLIEIRDVLTETKEALRQLALSEIDQKNSLWDKLKPAIDKTYGPLAKLNAEIEFIAEQLKVEIDHA
jgi:hypothetical protein